MRRSAIVTGMVALLVGIAASGPAGAAEPVGREPSLVPGIVTPPPADAPPLVDRVIPGTSHPLPRRRAINAYTTPAGDTVYVDRSGYYGPNPQADQELVDFLDGLLHGRELDGLLVEVVGPPEMPVRCGEGAAACYYPSQDLIVVVGEPQYGGLPTDYVLAHEYGHHVANHRRNPPFAGGALDWGTKRWASYIGVCRGTRTGRIDPDDYFQHPGEAYAESYAEYHFPPNTVAWEWDNFFKPDATSRARLATDVRNPWRSNRKTAYAGRIRSGRAASINVKTPLDGRLIVKLRGPRRADFDLFLYAGRKRVARSTKPRSRERVSYTVCGEAKLRVEVRAVRGSGKARVKVSRP